MHPLTHSPFLKALGWTLLNSVWQFGLLCLFFRMFIRNGKKYTPAIKHGLALALTTAGFLWFAAGLSFQYFAYSDSLNTSVSPYNFSGTTFYSYIYNGVKPFLENNLSYLSMFYLLMVAGFFVRFFRFFFYAQSIQQKGLIKMKPELRLYVQKLVQQLNIGFKVQVWISEHIDTPMVIGFIKPIILIPIACINQLSSKQLEAILLHELAHIKRNDYLINLYIAIIEILFFFNPFARILVSSIKEEREKSCDDWVLQFRFDPYQYASALFSLEQSRLTGYSLAIAATGEKSNLLLQRIQRIMGVPKNKPESGFKLLAYLLTIGLLSFIALVNPGNLVVENFEKSFTGVKKVTPQFASTLEQSTINNNIAARAVPLEKVRERKVEVKPVTVDTTGEDESEDEFINLTAALTANEKEEVPRLALFQSVTSENKDFSIRDKDPEIPVASSEVEYPFVPNSSYSYYNTEDSNVTKLKIEKNRISKVDQTVSQSLAEAQKAIDKLDWNRIAKSQKLSKSSLLKLQKELKQSLHNLNWSQIYTEIRDSINKASTENIRSSLKAEYNKMNDYKLLQQQYESIKNELQQQQEKYKKGVELQLQEIEKQVKKAKVIVYI